VGRRLASRFALRVGEAVPGREHFLLEKQLTGTAGSEVWLARHDKTQQARVYKFSADGAQLAALKREATLCRVLLEALGEREDIVGVVDWNFESAPFFLEYPYAGENLIDWDGGTRLAQMPLSERVELALQIAGALADAHGVGVLHKDLKPGNVLVGVIGEGWQMRLADFGSGRLLDPEQLAALGITALGLTQTQAQNSSSGTPLYLAPELVQGRAPTVQSDVYALGVLLYQIAGADLRKPLAPGWEADIDDPLLC
jgi:non-specific serine/threonine protein kinase